MQTLEFSESPKFTNALRQFCANANATGDVSDVVTPVLADVKARGDKAVLDYTQKFDGAKLSAKAMRVDPAEMKAALKSLSVADRKAIRESIALVKEFHKKTRQTRVVFVSSLPPAPLHSTPQLAKRKNYSL